MEHEPELDPDTCKNQKLNLKKAELYVLTS